MKPNQYKSAIGADHFANLSFRKLSESHEIFAIVSSKEETKSVLVMATDLIILNKIPFLLVPNRFNVEKKIKLLAKTMI